MSEDVVESVFENVYAGFGENQRNCRSKPSVKVYVPNHEYKGGNNGGECYYGIEEIFCTRTAQRVGILAFPSIYGVDSEP